MTTNIDDGQDFARQTQEDQDNDDRTFGSYFRTIRCTEPYPSRFIAFSLLTVDLGRVLATKSDAFLEELQRGE